MNWAELEVGGITGVVVRGNWVCTVKASKHMQMIRSIELIIPLGLLQLSSNLYLYTVPSVVLSQYMKRPIARVMII